ncbi:MAG: hypothetical protein HZA54_14735 [Planctomycetes bacterium]|nr:hypothetical protein [Planctomycetota bacterium]
MKSALMVVLIVAFCASSVFACASMHGNRAAASLNEIFGQNVAEGESGRGGDHGVYLEANGQSTSTFTSGNWDRGQEMIDWLLGTGLKIQENSSSYSNSVFEG